MTEHQSATSLAKEIIEKATVKGVMIAAAESCTGGMISAALTDIPGSSAVVDRGFVTYTNAAKNEMLGVPFDLINGHGAVSEEVALAMAAGALVHSRAEIAVSITGIAGPTGGSDEKPVGLVWFAIAKKGARPRAERKIFEPRSRCSIRSNATVTALQLIINALD